jgi:FkbM family methyltransferase
VAEDHAGALQCLISLVQVQGRASNSVWQVAIYIRIVSVHFKTWSDMEVNTAGVDVSPRTIQFDRLTGEVEEANLIEKAVILALQAGSKVTRPFGHRGYSLGCKAVSIAAPERNIIVRLNHDAQFATPFADRYWSRILNKEYSYEEEIEYFLQKVANLKYTFIDCGANFGYWSVLVTSEPFGRQAALAIEASPKNTIWLEANAKLNGNRFRCLNAAIGQNAGGFVRITGHKHEAFGTAAIDGREKGDVGVISLDSLIEDRQFDLRSPVIVKLDVEGVEIAALKGAERLLSLNSIVICEEHGSDRDHLVSRYLNSISSMKLYVWDPASARFIPVEGTSLDRIKRYAWVGYNVFATASPFWQARLLSAR